MSKLPVPRSASGRPAPVQRAARRWRAKRRPSVVLEYHSPTAALLARPVPIRRAYIDLGHRGAVRRRCWRWSTLVPVDRVVTTAGKVTAVSGNLMVQPLEVSLVRAIDVKEGQLVHAGDVLAELDPTFAQADAGSLETQVASLQAEVDRLTAEQQNRPYLSPTDRRPRSCRRCCTPSATASGPPGSKASGRRSRPPR